MHLEDEQIQRLLHGELDPRAEEVVIWHSVSCAECRLRLDDAEREEKQISELLRRMDHAPPDVDAETLAARARGGVKIDAANRAKNYLAIRARGRVSGGGRAVSGSGASLTLLRWAAGVLIALGVVGVAYAAPGSPLRAWVSRFAELIGGPAPRQARDARATSPPRGSAGIAVAPSEHFVIHFATAQASGVVAVSLTEGPDITARASSGTATFNSDIDSLTIENEGSTANYEIDVPRDARWVEIRVGGRRLLLKRGDSVFTEARTDARGRYILPLTPPGK